MSGAYTPTGTYSNLTRLELEELRRSDFATGRKALTVGDAASGVENIVGRGSLTAEPYTTGPSVRLDDIYPLSAPSQPGPGLLSTTSPGGLSSETVRWWGPTLIYDSFATGYAVAATVWRDDALPSTYPILGVQIGDVLLVKPTPGPMLDQNASSAASISGVAASSLIVGHIWNPANNSTSLDFAGGDKYNYLIVRPTAVQLFAVPGSGPVGREQTFLFVQPGAAINSQNAPTVADIEAARITDIVPPGSDPTMDRADFVYPLSSLGRDQLKQSLETIGYRVVLYPGLALGGPDLASPIASLNPVIDSTLPQADQRMTIDYKAGVVRFSCAPRSSNDINPNGAVNGTTGRLQLYAVFWSYDLSLTRGSARSLWEQRSDTESIRTPARIFFNTTPADSGTPATHAQGWRLGTSQTASNYAYVKGTGTETDLSTPDSNPFLAPWERRSTEFGTMDTDSGLGQTGLRYLSYRPTMGWRFLNKLSGYPFFDTFGYGDAEMVVADKTELTISDGSSPAKAFSADLNPISTYGFSEYGIRSHNTLTQATFAEKLAESPYGTAHFRKGVYYLQEAINVPPGATIEGEGPGTKFIFRNFESATGLDRVKGIFKVGPNTTWGVYDASASPLASSAYETSIAPEQFAQPTPGQQIEGMDLVWNPVRRTWGSVVADVTTGAVFFNEFRPDGTRLFPGSGINIKDNANLLFSQASLNGEHHSGGHYPRLAFHMHTGQYIVVWVEEFTSGGFIGPRVAMRYFSLAVDATDASGWSVSYPYGGTIYPTRTKTFSDHPSVAIEDYNVQANQYWAAVCFWSYTDTVPGQINGSDINRRYFQSGVEVVTTTTALQTREVCSSTDVKADELGGFLTVFSVRAHRYLRGSVGVITAVAGPESHIIDPGFNFGVENVVPGSKFFLLVSTVSPTRNGSDGVVYDSTGLGGAQARIKYETGAAFGAEGAGVVWAMTPPVRVNGVRSTFTGGTQSEDALLHLIEQISAATYNLEIREPDYVRLSRGGGGWCMAFQGYNSVGWPALTETANYDFGFNSTPTQFGIDVGDPNVYREHVSTCALILGNDGRPVYPTTNQVGTDATGSFADSTHPQFISRSMRDVEVSLKSLGTRAPLTERPNYMTLFGGSRVPINAGREVSFQNYSYRWMYSGSYKGVKACIPGITWTGQDWAIVSPAKPQVHSFTGHYRPGGGVTNLSDVMFYFGKDEPGTFNFGWPLRRTLSVGNSYIYLPATGASYLILSVVDEHTVQFLTEPLGGVDLSQVEWMLITPDYPTAAGIKNQGFRVNPEGRILTSTSFVTWADEPEATDSAYWKREIELMRRPTVRGGNYPSQVAGGITESNDPLEAGSRIKGNINFRGVAPGRPKGTNQHTANLSPKIALAWGDNLYGLLDHVVEGNTGSNNIEFYRQSYGPYNVTLRNFTAETAPTSTLQIMSRAHVYTRHYAPTASNVSFDTDGFRNVFVYPGSRVVTWYKAAFGIDQVTSYIGAVYTDALGQNPIQMQGPILARGDLDLWSSDVSEDVVLADPNDRIRCVNQGTGPKVIWDGQRFVVVWVERSNRFDVGTGGVSGGFHGQGYLLCLSYLPGSEDGGLQSTDLLYPWLDTDMALSPLAATTIEDGTGWRSSNAGITFGISPNTVAVCEVAFSGKVYAVVWVAGTVPDYGTTLTRGSAIGVTLFNLDSAVPATVDSLTGKAQTGGGNTYIIEQSGEPGAFHNPKIIWDGNRFVVFFESTVLADTANPPTLFTAMAFALVPEEGLARPAETKMISGNLLGTGTPYTTVYPGTGAPYSTTTHGGGQLGFAIFRGFLPAGSPYYGASHTVIQLWGNPIAIATQVTMGQAITTPGLGLFTATGNFITRGVRPGDYLLITAGTTSADVGQYIIEEVTATTLTINTDYYTFVGDTFIDFSVARTQQPGVQAGDTLVLSKTFQATTGTYFSDSAGVYPIVHYDPRTRRATVQGRFAADDVYPQGNTSTQGALLFGEIRGGGMSNYDNAPSLSAARTGISPRAYALGNAQWATGSAAADVGVMRLWGAAYNDVDDEFGLLFSHMDGVHYFTRFKANTRSSEPEVLLMGTEISALDLGADIAWNGAYYLTVGSTLTIGPLAVHLRALLLNRRGGIEGQLDLEPNLISPGQPNFLFGNADGQLPGPGYGAFPNYVGKGTGVVWPLLQNVKVKWNPRLSRWVVSASVLWYDQTPSLLNPNVYSDDGTTTFGHVIASWVGRTITFGGPDTLWQPGMKLAIYDAIAGNLHAVVTIIELVGAGPTYDQVIVDATTGQIVASQVAAKPIIREDVLCWTLGQDARGLILEDADNVAIEDVVIGGNGTDIEESWPNMTRPVWQAGGQTFGQPTNVNFSDFASLTKPPGYNHRFMTPAGKANLPTYTNMTSAGRHPYGRKPLPGAGYQRDKLRNRGNG